VAFIACEPSFLAHAALMTADIALTAMLLPALYFFSKNRCEAWLRRIALPAFWFGACLVSKASALVYMPVGMLIIELMRVARAGAFRRLDDEQATMPVRLWQRFGRPLAPFIKDATRIGVFGLVLAFLYCGCDWRVETTWVKWAQGLSEGLF